MITPPREPIGHSKDSIWLRDLLRYVRSIAVKEGTGYTRNVTSEGTILQINPGGGSSKADPIKVYVGVITAIFSDWYQVQNLETSAIELVAKPPKLRQSIATQVLDGVTVSYSYPNGDTSQLREASIQGNFVETQIVLPRYLTGDKVWYVPADTQTTASIPFLDLNIDARAWARKYV